MKTKKLTDREGKAVLKEWPIRTRKLFKPFRASGYWLRAQPPEGNATGPRLLAAGSKAFRTQPDGLWLFFNELEFVDVIAIEVCGTRQNLNDKRSRYMTTNHALLADCTESWMSTKIAVQNGGRASRWLSSGTISSAPRGDHKVPVRHLRVLYALPATLYVAWANGMSPGAHEYFCKQSSLTSYTSQAFRKFISKMTPGAQFYNGPS